MNTYKIDNLEAVKADDGTIYLVITNGALMEEKKVHRLVIGILKADAVPTTVTFKKGTTVEVYKTE